MYITKNRNGPDGLVFPIFMDTTNVKIQVLAKVDTPIINTASSSADLSKSLQDKYKQFRQAKKQNLGGV